MIPRPYFDLISDAPRHVKWIRFSPYVNTPDLRVSGLQLGTHYVMQSNYELIKEQVRNISGSQIKLTGIYPPLKHKK